MENSPDTDAGDGIIEVTTIVRSPAVLAAEVEGEIVMMSIEQGRYFGLDDIGFALVAVFGA